MKAMLTVLCTATAIGAGARAQNTPEPVKLEGAWQGTLKAGPAELRLVLHIEKNRDGQFRGTLDSIDQNANGMPVTSITLKESNLSFNVDAVQGSYQGKINTEGTEIEGTRSQGQALPLDFKRASAAVKTEHKPAPPTDVDGAWMGTLDAGGTKLRLVFHISNTEDGLTATMDSLDQDLKAMPATGVTRDGASLKIEMKQIAGEFAGTIDKDRKTIQGTWSQAGNSLPLVLTR